MTRREQLVERSAAQRAALVAAAAPLLERAASVDRVVGAVGRHPLLTVAAAGALLFVGRRRLLDLAGSAATRYMLFRRY
ncbi:MAG: hypothetical protein ACT4P3_10390 [Betaproteobacteria bacterium]